MVDVGLEHGVNTRQAVGRKAHVFRHNDRLFLAVNAWDRKKEEKQAAKNARNAPKFYWKELDWLTERTIIQVSFLVGSSNAWPSPGH